MIKFEITFSLLLIPNFPFGLNWPENKNQILKVDERLVGCCGATIRL